MAIKKQLIVADKSFKMYKNNKYNVQFRLDIKQISQFKVHLIKNIPESEDAIEIGNDIKSKLNTTNDILIFNYGYIQTTQPYTISKMFKLQYTANETSQRWNVVFQYQYDTANVEVKMSVNNIKVYCGQGYKQIFKNISDITSFYDLYANWNVVNIPQSDISFGNNVLLNGMTVSISNNIGYIVSKKSFYLLSKLQYILSYRAIQTMGGNFNLYIIKQEQIIDVEKLNQQDKIISISNESKIDDNIYFNVSEDRNYKLIMTFQDTITTIGGICVKQNTNNNISPYRYTYSVDVPFDLHDNIISLKLQYYNQSGKKCQYESHKNNNIIRGGNITSGGSSTVIVSGESSGSVSQYSQQNILNNSFRSNQDIVQGRVLALSPTNKEKVIYADNTNQQLSDIIGISTSNASFGQIVKVGYNGLLWVDAISYNPLVYNDRFYLSTNGKITNIPPTIKYSIILGYSVDYDTTNNRVKLFYEPQIPVFIKD